MYDKIHCKFEKKDKCEPLGGSSAQSDYLGKQALLTAS